MMDLNKIRSLRTLEEMKDDLANFLAFDRNIMLAEYDRQKWGEEDYEADKEEASDLLEQVEHRIKSLDKHLKRQKASPKSSDETVETAAATST